MIRPPFLTIAPATPPPCWSRLFAAFTIASTSRSVRSADTRRTVVLPMIFSTEPSMPTSITLQLQLHIKRIRDNMLSVGGDILKPERVIQHDRLFHGRQGVQSYAEVARPPGLVEERRGKAFPDLFPPEFGPEIHS